MSSKELNKSQPLIESLSRLDLSSVSQLRPNALTDCTTNEIKRFIKEYSNYALHRGTASAISLVHRDVISFYRYFYDTDLTSDKNTDPTFSLHFLRVLLVLYHPRTSFSCYRTSPCLLCLTSTRML